VQLSLHGEYSLRVLLYLGTQKLGAEKRRVIPTKDISTAFDISKNHLVRVMQTLCDAGYVELIPGRSGGVALAMEPDSIGLGEVVRRCEPGFRMAECFQREGNRCVVTSVCGLKPVLQEALDSFLAALDRYTLGDMIRNSGPEKLSRLFQIAGHANRPRNTLPKLQT
jgi:Rrf2 family nitric oxide-sensitive transcriptional repressor